MKSELRYGFQELTSYSRTHILHRKLELYERKWTKPEVTISVLPMLLFRQRMIKNRRGLCVIEGNIIMNWHSWLMCRLIYHFGFSLSVCILPYIIVLTHSAVGNIPELASVDARVLGSAWLA